MLGKIATELSSQICIVELSVLLSHLRLCGLMDKAPDFGSGDCRFKSCHNQHFVDCYFFVLNKDYSIEVSLAETGTTTSVIEACLFFLLLYIYVFTYTNEICPFGLNMHYPYFILNKERKNMILYTRNLQDQY